MGFINSASTTTLRLKLTDAGREQILNGGNLVDLFTKFGLSDGDIDYKSSKKHSDTSAILNDSDQLGFIPDITGNETTFRNSVNVGYRGNNHIWAVPEETKVTDVPNKFVSVGIKGTDGTTKYYRDNVVIDVYLHDYFVLNKLLMSRYVDDHKEVLSSASTLISTATTNYFENTLNVSSNGDYGMLLDKLSEYGIGQYLDFWSGIKVYDGNSLNTEKVYLESYDDSDYYNSIALAGGGYVLGGGRGEHTGVDFSGTNIKGLKIATPFSMLFSPAYSNKNNKFKGGAGNASIGFGAFDMGYLNVGGISPWDNNDDSYPKFIMSNTNNGWSTDTSDIKNTFVGFVSAVDMETKSVDFNSNEGYSNITTTIPTPRLVIDVSAGESSPKYYPIKLKRLSKTTDKIVDIGRGVQGIEVTDTNHPTDTYGLLSGSLEYVSDWNSAQRGFKSSAPYFNVLPSKDGGTTSPNKVLNKTEPYYTLGSRMMDMTDSVFMSLASQTSEYWKTDVYSGGFKAGLSGTSRNLYNISIPIKWTIYSSESPDASPVNVTVKFKFNKGAVVDSVFFDSSLSQDYYRVYDNATFKFYGEDGETLSSHSTDPRGHGYTTGDTYSWKTSNNKQLFRKLISGQEIKLR